MSAKGHDVTEPSTAPPRANEPMPSYGLNDDYPEMWEAAQQYDFAERLGGSSSKLLAEIDEAMRELWNARRYASRERRDMAEVSSYEKLRVVEFSFAIPFGGKPADICEEMIREHVTRSLLNSLSEIHPDIRCSIHTTRHQEAFRRNPDA